MSDFHGIIFAYGSVSELGGLVKTRTAASLPFCGRYRLIDFALSSMMNAGVLDVGVIMQRDYQSLLDHIGSGKDWDMGRRIGGLRMLPRVSQGRLHGNYRGIKRRFDLYPRAESQVYRYGAGQCCGELRP